LAYPDTQQLTGTGVTFAELRERSALWRPMTYRKNERDGFKAESGKVELIRCLRAALPSGEPPEEKS
jgi:hypothetical protein